MLTLDDLLSLLTPLTHPIPSIIPLASLLYLHNSTGPQATTLAHLFPALLSPALLYIAAVYAAFSWVLAALQEIDQWLLDAGPGIENGGWALLCALLGLGQNGKRGRGKGRGRRREVKWKEEVLLVTGGMGGLGREIVELALRRGARVAVVDVVGFEVRMGGPGVKKDELMGWTREDGQRAIAQGREYSKEQQQKGDDKMAEKGEADEYVGVWRRWARWGDGIRGRWRYYKVDVGDARAVEELRERVRDDLGHPTILINNAGITHSKPLLELSASEVESSFRINTLSHFHAIRTFLPDMLASERGGTIVTVASVLGYLGCAGLTDYAASKAALIAMHTSLRAELSFLPSAAPISLILATPGQLQTPLFSHLPPPLLSRFAGPVVEPKDLAQRIVEAVGSGKPDVRIAMPAYTGMVQWGSVLPRGLWRVVRGVAGVDRAGWRGVENRKRTAGRTV